jgi:hypothetical protein
VAGDREHLGTSPRLLRRTWCGCQWCAIAGSPFDRANPFLDPASAATAPGVPADRQSAPRPHRSEQARSTKYISMGSRLLNDIPLDVQQALLREQSALGLIQALAQDRNLPKIAEGEVRPMTAAQTAQQFLDGIGTERRKKVDGSG